MNHASRDTVNMLTAAVGSNITRQTDNTAITATITKDGSELIAFLLILGTLADVDTTLTVALEDSDDDVTYAAVATKYYNTSAALTGLQYDSDNAIRHIAYFGPKKYVKLTVTPANNTGNLDSCIVTLKGNSRVQP